METSNILFHPSSMGALMTGVQLIKELTPKQQAEFQTLTERHNNPSAKPLTTNMIKTLDDYNYRVENQGKYILNDELGLTALSVVSKTYIENAYKRYQDIKAMPLEKGKRLEEDSITVYSQYKQKFFTNNKRRVKNDFWTGEIDIRDESDVIRVIDIKTPVNIFTFFKKRLEGMNNDYKCQLNCYYDLEDAAGGAIAYVLTNEKPNIIENRLFRASFEFKDNDITKEREYDVISNCIYDQKTLENFLDDYLHCVNYPEYILERFVEIPFNERVFEMEVEKDAELITAMKQRVVDAREYIANNF